MECPFCKSENDSDAIYCNHCGINFESRIGPTDAAKERLKLGLGLAILVIGIVLITWMAIRDLKSGKYAYSTKDGRFKEQVTRDNTLQSPEKIENRE